MKNLIFKGNLVTADFEKKTMTFEIENDMVVQAGNYTIVKTEDYEKLVNGVDTERKALHIDVSNPVKNAIAEVDKQEEKHIIYTINGKVKQTFKKWNFAKCEEVLKRLGAEYWEIG